MKPSRALYIICGACLLGGAVIQPPVLLFAVVTLVAALVFDHNDF